MNGRVDGLRRAASAAAVLACAVCVGCRSAEEVAASGPFERAPVQSWPSLVDDQDTSALVQATENGLRYLDGVDPATVYRFGSEKRTAAEMSRGMRRFLELLSQHRSPDSLRTALAGEFMLLRSRGRDGRGSVLFTGYFEPVLTARSSPLDEFRYPVYGVPSDLVIVDLKAFGLTAQVDPIVGRVEDGRLVPYPERFEIDFGPGLQAPTPVLGYLSSRVELFFLHVQGSGTLVFEDGRRLRAGFAATNGRPYRSIGKLLIDDGLVPRSEMSMQAITAYLASHPGDVPRVLSFNPSYVFFRPLDATDGPLGCFAVPVIAGRAIATDRRLIPAPALTWIEGVMPDGQGGRQRFSRFAVNLDTGSSILGPGRVDLFIGTGRKAGQIAGAMRDPGRLYLLLPRSI